MRREVGTRLEGLEMRWVRRGELHKERETKRKSQTNCTVMSKLDSAFMR
jgi:hypothetical protein